MLLGISPQKFCLIKNAHGNTAVVGNPCAASHRERQPSCWELPPLDTQQEHGVNPPDPSSTVIEVALGKAVGVSCFIEKKKKKRFLFVWELINCSRKPVSSNSTILCL